MLAILKIHWMACLSFLGAPCATSYLCDPWGLSQPDDGQFFDLDQPISAAVDEEEVAFFSG